MTSEDVDTETREELSDYSHYAWSTWVASIIKDYENDDGSVTIPKGKIDRWKTLKGIPYEKLPEVEKDKDRVEADEIIDIIDVNPIGIKEENNKMKKNNLKEQNLSKLQIAYREFFKAMMDEYDVKSPVQLGDKRSEFFSRIKKEWPAAKKKIQEGVLRKTIRNMISEILTGE